MTDTPTLRQSCVSSISLPRDLSEWVESQSKSQNIAKSKVIQLALTHYRNSLSGAATDATTAG